MKIKIEKLVYGGDGLGRLPPDDHGRGKTVFVPFVLEEETVDARLNEQKRGFARAVAETITTSSPHRVVPACPYFQHCGGCNYQHSDYAHQLEIKAGILKENLRRIARLELDCELQIHESPQWNYRNRVRLKVRSGPEFALGYFKFSSHELLAIEQCPISSPLINRAIAAFWQFGRSGKVPAGLVELELFADAQDKSLLVEAYFTAEASRSVVRQCCEAAAVVLQEIAGVAAFRRESAAGHMEPKPIAVTGASEVIYKTGSADYRVTAGAFFQVNRHLVDKLAELVTAEQWGKLALDLYAGVGLFSTRLARSFSQIIAVESSQTSFADLTYNCPTNVKGIKATTEQFLEDDKNSLADLIVVDPPRSGLGESVVQKLGSMGGPRLTYVSCDPATLARDLVGLLGSGYRIEQAHMVDLFPQTYHVESVFHLVR